MIKQEETQCPNCSKMHKFNGNGYCEKCSARFRRLGMYDWIGKDMFRDTVSEKTQSFDEYFIPLVMRGTNAK